MKRRKSQRKNKTKELKKKKVKEKGGRLLKYERQNKKRRK